MLTFNQLVKIKDEHRESKKLFVANIINSSSPKIDFYVMVILSTLITSLGILADSIALVIAGMIVAPLLSPILAISLGLVIFNFKLILRSIKIIFASLVLAVSVSIILGLIFNIDASTMPLVLKMEISNMTFAIAVVAGFTASYAWTRQNSKDYLSAIAIAVTIIPPLTAIGLTIANLNYELTVYVALFFLMNVLGIMLGSLLVFSFMSFYKVKKVVNKEIKKEEIENNN